MAYKTFKQLVILMSNINSEEDMNAVCGEIDKSFQNEKISWNDHQILYDIMRIIEVQ